MKYFEAYKEKHQLVAVRKYIVEHAMSHTNESAAAMFGCSRNTVSKWKGRYIRGETLADSPRIPNAIPHKITEPALIAQICKLREATGYSAERLEKQFELPVSNMTIDRILREHDPKYPSVAQKKHQTKQQLWDIKQHYKTLETKLQMDGKDLMDIPRYYRNQREHNLPKQMFNMRCVKSGITFTSFMNQENGDAACTFVVYVFEHLKRHGVDVSKLTIQVDAASYAISMRSPKISRFRKLVEETYQAKLRIVPGGKTKQSDVETFNGIVEREFFNRHDFSSTKDFYKKAYQFLFEFNFIRKNRNKGWKTPLHFLSQDQPKVTSDVLLLPPINLDSHGQIYTYKLNPKALDLKDIISLEQFFEENEFIEKEAYNEMIGSLPNNYRHINEYVAHDVPIYVSI